MTITSTPTEVAYSGDNVSTTFGINFPFDSASDLKVIRADATGNLTVLTSGFTVSGGGGSTGSLTLTSALATGYRLTILDDPQRTQDADYIANDDFPAEAHEKALDKGVRISKRLYQLINRAIRAPDGDISPAMLLPAAPARAGLMLTFDGAGNAFLAPQPIAGSVTQSLIGLLLNPRTAAESAAGVTPTNYVYPPGDMRRYGTCDLTGVADSSTSWLAAVAQAQQAGGAAVFVPPTASGILVNTGATAILPIRMTGVNFYSSIIKTTADIILLDITIGPPNSGGGGTLGPSSSYINNVQFQGKGKASATQPAVRFTNSYQNSIEGCFIHDFGYGVYFKKGANSSYLNCIKDSYISGNGIVNIYGERQTNALNLHHVTFGSSAIGLYLVDSTSLCIFGGDVEGCTTAAVDLDCINGAFTFGGHGIFGLHMEGNTTTGGDVRIGNSGINVTGVELVGVAFGPNGSAGAINAVNCSGLFVRGTMSSSQPFLKKTNLANEDIDLLATTGNVPRYKAIGYKAFYGDESAVAQRSALFIDGNYADSLNFSQYQIMSGSAVAGKDYYNSIDLIELGNGTATAANVKLYARLMYALNSKGDSTKVGAAKIVGDVDALSGAWSFGSSATNPAVASSGTIGTTGLRHSRVSPTGNVTGVILQAGLLDGQVVTAVNQSAFTITFATAGTSNVADGTTSAIPANCSRNFRWMSSSSLWFRDA